LGVGNKTSKYTEADQDLVATLSDMAWDIIENKLNEEALKESKTVFTAFMENSPIYVFFKDKEIRSKQLSRNFEKMLGKPLEELLDKNMFELFPSEMAANMVKVDQRILSEGRTVEVEEELNGRHYTTIKFPIFKDGVPDSLAGFTLDITDRVLSERKLAESEELYRLISSVVSDYLFSSYIDENNILTLRWVAGAFEKITGYSMAEYTMAGGWRAHVYPEDYPLDDNDLEILRENKKVITEIRTIKKDGSVLWVQVYSQPIWDEEKNQLVGINGAVQDITERKRTEEEIKKSALEFEALYETAKDFSQNRDPNMILRTITDRACSMFGVSTAFVYIYDPETKHLYLKASTDPSHPIGQKLELGEGLSGKVAELQQAISLEDYSTWPGRLDRMEGNTIAAILCVPMLFGGELIGVLGVQERHPSKHTFSDSDTHFLSLFGSQAAGALYSAYLFDKIRRNAVELEKRVDERTKELQLKNKELETFTYTVSHDLKAPLRGISGYSTLLMEDHEDQLDEEGKRYLTNLVKSTERMNLLIEDLLAYSRTERREIKLTDIHLEEMIDKLLIEHHADIEKRNIIISKELVCPILFSDREALIQALRNLIDNAIKFTNDRPDPKIVIRSEQLDDHCLITVEDNGVGFDMQYQDKIFEIFQRLHLSEDYPGTGVGLALVRKAVDRLGGKVWAVSEPGIGSTFYLELPL
jgi:PAS domain S-box-containing protein